MFNNAYRMYMSIGDFVRETCAAYLLRAIPSVTPNQVTVVATLVGICAAVAFALQNPIVGGLLYYASDVLDGMDGAVARAKKDATVYGAYFDSMLDRYVDILVILGIMASLAETLATIPLLTLTVFVILGSFLQGYASHRAEALGKVVLNPLVPFSRRTRMHIMLLGIFTGNILAAAILIAVIGNINVLLRLHPSMLKDPKTVSDEIRLAKSSREKILLHKS